MPFRHPVIPTLPEYPRWIELVEAAGLSAHRDTLEAYLLPTIALDPVPLSDGAAVVSRLGGEPDLPADVAWPTWRGEPLAFVAQLVIDDALRALDLDGRLPDRGLISVFVHLGVPDHADHCELRWFPSVDDLARRAAPGARLTLPVAMRWQPRLALSVDSGELLDLDDLLDADASDAFHDDVVIELRREGPMHRLFGHPNATSWLSERGGRFLLQIDSDDRVGLEMGDVETLRIYVRGDRLDAATLATAECTTDEG